MKTAPRVATSKSGRPAKTPTHINLIISGFKELCKMEISEVESQFVWAYRAAKRDNNSEMLICICAILLALSRSHDAEKKSLLNGFSRGQYKRAIKSLCESRAEVLREGNSELLEDYDSAVRYIRENCLSRTGVAA